MTCALIESNAETSKQITDKLVADVEELIEQESGRSLGYVMALYERVASLSFGGSDLPAVYVQIKQIADLTARETQSLTKALSRLLAGALSLDETRVYIVYETIKPQSFGFNGSNF